MHEKPPAHLGEPGSALWDATVSAFELNPVELSLLGELARLEDLLTDLHAQLLTSPLMTKGSYGQERANPLISQITALVRVQSRTVQALGLPLLPEQENQQDGTPPPLTFRGQRGKAA